jgi:hypothetical protein
MFRSSFGLSCVIICVLIGMLSSEALGGVLRAAIGASIGDVIKFRASAYVGAGAGAVQVSDSRLSRLRTAGGIQADGLC